MMMDEKRFCALAEEITNVSPVAEQLKSSRLPLVIWGIGSMSYSVKKYMDILKVAVNCYWVDGDCKIKDKGGIPVLSLTEIENRFDKFNVVFGHYKYELKKSLQKRCKNIQHIFCIPNVCYNRYDRMPKSFFEHNAKRYYENYCLLEDEKSKECMTAYLRCKMSENIDDIIDVFEEELNYFNNPVFTLRGDEVYVDVGAYTGDSLELFLKETNQQYKKIYAYEPEKANFLLLKNYVEEQNLKNVVCEQIGTYNRKETLLFALDEESSGITSGGETHSVKIEVNALDSLLEDEEVTLVKINFLAGVKETIEGMRRIMVQCKPKLVVTVGFDEYALLSIPALIKEINPDYRLFLRFAAAMPARLLLFAI